MNRRHLHNLCALLGDDLDVERARDEYLASLDADEGLAVLLISDDEILAAATARPPVLDAIAAAPGSPAKTPPVQPLRSPPHVGATRRAGDRGLTRDLRLGDRPAACERRDDDSREDRRSAEEL